MSMNWTEYQKNASVFWLILVLKDIRLLVIFFEKNSETLFCKLEDGVVFNTGLSMVIFHGDPLMGGFSEIIDLVVEESLYNYWITLRIHWLKLRSR